MSRRRRAARTLIRDRRIWYMPDWRKSSSPGWRRIAFNLTSSMTSPRSAWARLPTPQSRAGGWHGGRYEPYLPHGRSTRCGFELSTLALFVAAADIIIRKFHATRRRAAWHIQCCRLQLVNQRPFIRPSGSIRTCCLLCFRRLPVLGYGSAHSIGNEVTCARWFGGGSAGCTIKRYRA